MQGGPAKTMLLGVGGQRSRCGVSGDAQDNVVDRINVPFQTYLSTVRRDGAIGQIEVAATGHLIGENFAAG